MTKRKTRTRSHVISDMSLHHLGYLVAKGGYALEYVRSDYGYDASIFTFSEHGEFENGTIYVQIKATDAIKIKSDKQNVSFNLEKRDIKTWECEPFPVFLVVFDARSEISYYIHLQEYFTLNGISSNNMKKKSVDVHLPMNPISPSTFDEWRAIKNAILNEIGAVRHA